MWKKEYIKTEDCIFRIENGGIIAGHSDILKMPLDLLQQEYDSF